MDTKAKLENDLKDAMRSGDELRKRTIRMVLTAIRLAEVDRGESLDENTILSILQRDVKAHQESIEDARKAGRPDLESNSQAELEVLEGYLPQQLGEDELEVLAKQAIADAGASSLREMGQVMKILMPRLQGRATGDQASRAVRKLLS
jgi:hypothetical protein